MPCATFCSGTVKSRKGARCPIIQRHKQRKMTQTSLTFEEIDAILALIEFHDDWEEISEKLNVDISTLYEKLSEMRDEV